MLVEILEHDQHRALAFVSSCNSNGYAPTDDELERWLAHQPSVLNTIPEQLLSSLVGAGWKLSRSVGLHVARSTVEVLEFVRWVSRERGRLEITPLGKALLTGAEGSAEVVPDLSVVVLGADDPLAYPLLIGRLAGLSDGLLIDPFLGVEQLHEIIQSTRVSRILVSDGPSATRKRAAMATYLRSKSIVRDIEVRAAPGLHDRFVLSEDESFTLGTSLNGVGRTTTVLSPLPGAAAAALLAEMSAVWEAAETLVPIEDTSSDAKESATELGADPQL